MMGKFVVTASAVARLKPLLQTHQNTLDETFGFQKLYKIQNFLLLLDGKIPQFFYHNVFNDHRMFPNAVKPVAAIILSNRLGLQIPGWYKKYAKAH